MEKENIIINISPEAVFKSSWDVIDDYLGKHGETNVYKLSKEQKQELIQIMEKYWKNHFVSDSFIDILSELRATIGK